MVVSRDEQLETSWLGPELDVRLASCVCEDAPMPDDPSQSPALPAQRIGLPGAAWAMYDFGFSLFAFAVFARYLSDWLITDLKYPDYYYTTTQAVTAACLLVLMPSAGALATRIGRHVPLLAGFSLLSGAAAIAMGLTPPGSGLMGILPILVLGGLCAGMAGLAFAQFDPLLPAVAPRQSWGTLSGIATASGYVGIITAILVFSTVVVGDGDKQQAFIPAGIAFLACTVPLVLLVRERPARNPADSQMAHRHLLTDLIESVGGSMRLIAEVLRFPSAGRLLAGRFLYTDAVGTLNIYLVVYISRVGGFTEARKDLAILLGVVFAGIGGVASGVMVKQLGPKRTLLIVLPAFTIALIITAAAGTKEMIWLLAPVIGFSYGTVNTADRVFMLALTPEDRRGEFFGVFNLVGRVAQAAGPLVFWGGTIWLLHDSTGWLSALDASRIALIMLGLSAMVGLLIIRPLSDQH